MSKQFQVRIIAKVRHEALIKLRQELGWTQDKLAEYLGVGKSCVVNWEALKKFPRNPNTLEKLSELTGLTTEELFPSFIKSPAFQALPKTASRTHEVDPAHLLASGNVLQALPLPDEMIEIRDLTDFLAEALADPTPPNLRNTMDLSSRELYIMKEYFLSDDEEISLRKIGQHLGRSVERIRGIRNKALQKIRHELAIRFRTGTTDPEKLRPLFQSVLKNLER